MTVVGFTAIVLIVWLRSLARPAEQDQNLVLTVSSDQTNVELSQVVDLLRSHCAGLTLKRFDQSSEMFEARFLVEFDGFSQLESARSALQSLGDSLRITLLDYKGLE